MARWTRAGVAVTVLVLIGMAVFVTAVYAVVVRGGVTLLGALDRPHVGLSVLATAMVALGFEPVRRSLHRAAVRLVGHRRAGPYDLLTGFDPEVVATDEVPERMARLLAEATGARSAQVLLAVGGAPVPVATWPPGAAPGGNPTALPVRHAGETLGELVGLAVQLRLAGTLIARSSPRAAAAVAGATASTTSTFIINRAVVLAILAAFVMIGYVSLVVGVGATLGTRLDRRFWPSLAALVVVALAFQPLRRRVLRLADRLVYGQRAVPYEALSDFTRRLSRSRAPEELLPAMAEALARGTGASHARVSLELPPVSATWPQPTDRVPDVDLAVGDRSGDWAGSPWSCRPVGAWCRWSAGCSTTSRGRPRSPCVTCVWMPNCASRRSRSAGKRSRSHRRGVACSPPATTNDAARPRSSNARYCAIYARSRTLWPDWI
jgi:hypothetical protein